MSYDRPNRLTYTFPALDWGANNSESFGIRGPKGKKGRLIDYGVIGVTEAFTSDDMTISVGTATDPDAFGDEFILNGAAAGSAKTVRSTYAEHEQGFKNHMVNPNLPADTDIVVTMTGASAAGIGTPFVVIDWDW